MLHTANSKVWEVFCSTENKWISTDFTLNKPTECPNSNLHSIVDGTIHIIKDKAEPDLALSDQNPSMIVQRKGQTAVGYYGHRSNEIHISQDGQSQYMTLSKAVQENSRINTVYIIHPGTYIEQNPIVIPYGCTVTSTGNAGNTLLIAANVNAPVLEIGLQCEIERLTIMGAVGPSGCGIYYDGSKTAGGNVAVLSDLFILDCYTGIRGINNIYNKIFARSCFIANATGPYCQNGIHISDNCDMNMSYCVVAGSPVAKIPKAINVSNARVHMSVTSIQYPEVGMHVDSNGEYDISECFITASDVGVCVGNIGSDNSIHANTLDIRQSGLYDIRVDADDATFTVNAGKLDPTKIYNPHHVKLNAQLHSQEQTKKFRTDTGDVRLGTMTEPSKLQIGEGKYVLEEAKILWNDNLEAGAWTDKTTEANSYDGSVFELFPDVTANSCVYIGSTYKILGLKSHVQTDAILESVDDVVWERWDGSEWIDTQYMCTNGSEPYFTYKTQFFEQDAKQHLRFGITKNSAFEKKILNGLELYWIRARVVNELSNGNPELEYIKMHTSSAKINTDGWLEYFGDARPVGRLPWSIDDTNAANASPSNRDMYLGDYLGTGRIENYFQNGAIDRIGFNSYLPQDIDTSFPIKLKWSFTGSSGAGNDIRWIIRWGFSKDGDDVYDTTSQAPTNAANEKSLEVITTVLGSNADKQITETAKINIAFSQPRPENGNPDIIWVTLERTGNHSSDTYGGHVGIIQFNAEYIRWCEGGHIHSF